MVADANVSLHLHLLFRCSISFRQWSTLIDEKVEASWNRGLEGRPLSLLLLSHSLLFGTLILMHGATRMEWHQPMGRPPPDCGAPLICRHGLLERGHVRFMRCILLFIFPRERERERKRRMTCGDVRPCRDDVKQIRDQIHNCVCVFPSLFLRNTFLISAAFPPVTESHSPNKKKEGKKTKKKREKREKK